MNTRVWRDMCTRARLAMPVIPKEEIELRKIGFLECYGFDLEESLYIFIL
jgi:hypothetical protein